MPYETKAELRDKLRSIGEALIAASENNKIDIDSIHHEVHAATCDTCCDYGREVFEVITFKYSR